MSTLIDVESVVARFSAEQLAELEQFVRQTRMEKTRGTGRSALDLPPLDLGRTLQPLGTRDEWYDEMLEARGLAATFRTAGIRSILPLNPADFAVFDEFACVPLRAVPAPTEG
jgi:hypothetical protein